MQQKLMFLQWGISWTMFKWYMKDLVTVTYITYIFQIWCHYYHEQVASIFWGLKTLKVHDSRQWILLDLKMTKVHSYYVSTTSSSISKRQCVRIVDQPDISLALACLKTPQLLKMITFCGYVFQTTYSIASSPDSQNISTVFESIWDLHVLEIFVSLFWKSSDSSSCDLGFSIDHHIHQLGVAVQSEWVHKRKSWVSVLYISLETLFQWGLFMISQ